MKKILFPLAFLYGCKVTFVPTKSQTAIDAINKIQTDANTLYSNISEASDKSFNTYEQPYLTIDTEIDSLIAFDSRRAKAGVIIKQDKTIQSLFDEYKNEHQQKVSITNSEIQVYQSYLKSVIDPRLISENSLQ